MATTAPEYTTALRLVAESVAEQRKLAARVIMGNLFCWIILPLILAVVHCYYSNHIDIPALLSFIAGAVTVLAIIVK
jgi:cobalamin biosynthesis protein CobD/CbiB